VAAKNGILLFDPANPYDWSETEIAAECRAITADLDDIEAVPALRQEVGYGGPLAEFWHLWMEFSAGVDAAAATALVGHTANKMRIRLLGRWRRDKDARNEGERPRPYAFAIYDREGEVIASGRVEQDGSYTPNSVALGDKAPHPRPPKTGAAK
jgi:hypothetical protein